VRTGVARLVADPQTTAQRLHLVAVLRNHPSLVAAARLDDATAASHGADVAAVLWSEHDVVGIAGRARSHRYNQHDETFHASRLPDPALTGKSTKS